jgi:chaperonin GroES
VIFSIIAEGGNFILFNKEACMRIKPLNDWVVIREAEAEEKSPGGIIIPEVAKEKPQWGTVVAAGPGAYKTGKEKEKSKEKKKFIPTEVKPGDRVLFEKYMARELETGGEKVTMVREEYVLGVLESKEGQTTAALQKKGSTAVEKTKKPASKAKPKK